MSPIQVLRTLDKADKLGVDGVIELLQKPVEEFGAGLDVVRANLIGSVLKTKGADNQETIQNLYKWFANARLIKNRLNLIDALEAVDVGEGRTAFDNLLAMPKNDDQTWRDGGRPENIAWALDDLVDAEIKKRSVS